MEKLKEIIGNDFKTYALKSLRRRFVQKVGYSEMPKQDVLLIITKAGERYKLLRFSKSNQTRNKFIREILPYLKTFDFVPKIIYLDEECLLAEYVEGVIPDIRDRKFVEAFAKNIAVVHKLNRRPIPKTRFMQDIQRDIDYLTEQGLMTWSFARRVIGKILELRPPNIWQSMVYGDQKVDNLIVDIEKKLYFVDLDAFRYCIMGYYLFRGRTYKNLDRKLFKISYMRAGGTEYLFKNERFLTLVFQVIAAAEDRRI